MPTEFEDADLFVTPEQNLAKLEAIEEQLAKKLNLPLDGIRLKLLGLDRHGELVEDELVSDWHELLAIHTDNVLDGKGPCALLSV
jgi:hypothetical protein